MSARFDTSLDARREAALAWCLRLADGPLEDAGREAFEGWLNSDPANAALFDEVVALWSGVEDQAGAPEMVVLRGQALEHQINLDKAQTEHAQALLAEDDVMSGVHAREAARLALQRGTGGCGQFQARRPATWAARSIAWPALSRGSQAVSQFFSSSSIDAGPRPPMHSVTSSALISR